MIDINNDFLQALHRSAEAKQMTPDFIEKLEAFIEENKLEYHSEIFDLVAKHSAVLTFLPIIFDRGVLNYSIDDLKTILSENIERYIKRFQRGEL